MPRRRHSRMQIVSIGLALLSTLLVANSALAAMPAGDRTLDLLAQQQADGTLRADTALLLSVQRLLHPDQLPTELRATIEGPLRCGTAVLREAQRRAPDFGPQFTAQLEAQLDVRRLYKASSYLSSAGHFVLSYETTGLNAVSTEDLTPANGIPDYVERVAQYFEESWTKEVEQLGFIAPDLQGLPYEVSFEAMGSYGYTTLSAASPGGTRIVMHNSFVGFPPNDDPEGNVLGAAKVTAAHEFKHAIQFATSQWEENGLWPELDATWAEDIVYDQVNDYYNYLPNGSPISAPSVSLDANGGGSYEDCIFQHWISETWGDSTIVELWQHRSQNPTEPMLDSYEWLFVQRGTTLDASWSDFATWNYATGSQALSGYGYGEAAAYPNGSVSGSYNAYPAVHAAVVGHLAANFSEFTGFSPEPGAISIRIQRQFPSTLKMTALVVTKTGSWNLHPLSLGSGDDTIELPEPLYSVDRVVLIASNGSRLGGSLAFTASLSESIVLPLSQGALDVSTISFRIAAGDSAGRVMTLRNVGQAGSVLNYRALPMKAIPPSTEIANDVTGSMMAVAASNYSPGSSADLFFSVTNNTADLEWLAGVDLQLPAGVVVDSTTNFVGGGAGDLVSNGAVGDSVTVLWLDANGNWGNIKNGETATAHVYVTFDAQLFGNLDLNWTIRGDGYGGGSHVVSGSLPLTGPANPGFQLLAPTSVQRFALGDSVDIAWNAVGETQVKLELSRDGGSTWETLADSTANDGNFAWVASGSATASARVRVSNLDASRSDSSLQSFWIYEPLAWLDVDPPAGGIGAGSELTLGLGFDAQSLSAGLYAGVLFFEHDGMAVDLSVPLSLDVRIDATPVTPSASGITLLGNQPNPFNPATKIHFSLAADQAVRIDVFNTSGRRVRTLVDRTLDAGDHYVDWASEDERGQRVASGTYYYTLRSSGDLLHGKMTLVK